MKSRVFLILLPLMLASTGCDLVGAVAGQATDEWTRRYSLAPDGTVEIGNTNGSVNVEAVDGTTVDVRAERVVRAATDAAARELLARLTINEEVGPDRVSLQTPRTRGSIFGESIVVRYDVRVPRNATIQVRTTNGRIAITGITGSVIARTTNGSLTANALGGAVDARSTNGSVSVEMAAIKGDRIALHTTNGRVVLTLPPATQADLSASWTNGGIDVSDLPLTIRRQSRRHLEARLNGGGVPIELQTTNGGIRVRTGA